VRSLVRAPFVAVKRTFKVPSSVVVAGTAARPLDCSLRSPNDLLGRHPASSGRACHACAAAGVDGQAARVRREVGVGPLSSTPTESVVARVALGGPPASPPKPSAPDPTHRSATRRPPPCAPQIGDREATRQLVSWACVHCGNLSINVLSPGGLCPLECLGALFCRTSGLNMRPGFAR